MSTMMWCVDVWGSSSVDQVHCQRGLRWTIKVNGWMEADTHTHTHTHTLVITSYVREQRETAESDWVSRTSGSPPLPSVCPSHCGLHLTVKSPTQHNNTQTGKQSERSAIWSLTEAGCRAAHRPRDTWKHCRKRGERERERSVCVWRGGDVM